MREHALVDQGAGRQRREVDAGLVLGALAQAEGEAVEVDAAARLAGGGDEDQLEGRHRAARHASRGSRGRPAPRASRGRSGPPRRRSSRPSAFDSAASVGIDRQERHARRRTCRPRAARRRHSSWRSPAGSGRGPACSMPAPSPVSGSPPTAPRWSRLRRAVRPWATISLLATPVRVATMATPQESCSFCGSYRPCAGGWAENWLCTAGPLPGVDGWIGALLFEKPCSSNPGRRWP